MSRKKIKINGIVRDWPKKNQNWKVQHRPGGWVILERIGKDGRKERIRGMVRATSNKLWAMVRGQSFYGEWQEARRSGTQGTEDSNLVAQFPGKVKKVLVAEGKQVKLGESLVLVEAMKMEFAVKAPYSGKVEKILVKDGQQLMPGDRLVDLKEASSV